LVDTYFVFSSRLLPTLLLALVAQQDAQCHFA